MFLYPTEPMTNTIDPEYQAEYDFQKSIDSTNVALVDIDLKKFRKNFDIDTKSVIWRGWMLSSDDYSWLSNFVSKNGGSLESNLEDYHSFHYINGWIDKIQDFTFKSFIFDSFDSFLTSSFNFCGLKYLVKDYVKSSNNPKYLFASNAADVSAIVKEIERYRGELEGGLVLREYVDIDFDSEIRFFSYNNVVFSSSDNVEIMQIVLDVARIINSDLLFSIDAVKLSNGEWTIVEIGDGQVSGLKEWEVSRFYSIF